jgi:uncharacterized protein YhjY with autotransporter beta-barrel domain
MKNSRAVIVLGAMLATGVAGAQETILGMAVEEVGSALQITTGDAVLNACVELATRDPQVTLNSDAQDLSLRCTEMVHTALRLEGVDPNAPTDLGLTSNQLASALQQIAGEENASKGRLATETSNGQFANIGLRIDAITRGARSTTAPGALAMGGRDLGRDGGAAAGGNAGDEMSGGGWGWFTTGALGSGDRDSSSREDGYDFDTYGLTFGADYQFQNGFVLGGGLGYSDFEVDFDDLSPGAIAATAAGGDIQVDGFSLSTFGVYDIGQFTLDGIFTYGRNDYDLERIVRYQAPAPGISDVDRLITGETESTQWAAGIDVGRNFAWGATSLYLDGGFNWLDIQIDGYTENDPVGGLNLTYGDQDIESLQSVLGFQLARTIGWARGVATPYVQAHWRHEFDNDSQTLIARFAAFDAAFPELRGDPSFNLAFTTDEPDNDVFDLGVGIGMQFAFNFFAFLDYSQTVALDNGDAHLISIGVRGAF